MTITSIHYTGSRKLKEVDQRNKELKNIESVPIPFYLYLATWMRDAIVEACDCIHSSSHIFNEDISLLLYCHRCLLDAVFLGIRFPHFPSRHPNN